MYMVARVHVWYCVVGVRNPINFSLLRERRRGERERERDRKREKEDL